MKYNYKKIGQRIKDTRKAAGYSQNSLIDALRDNQIPVGRNTLSSMENGDFTAFSFQVLSGISNLCNCEIGYLLCEYDCKTFDNSQIHEKTGLSDDAINTLKAINFRASTQHGNSALKRLSTLDYILKDVDVFEDFLSNLTLFIDNNYKTPIFWDPNKHCYIDTGYRYANGDIGVTFGYLTKDNKGNDGYDSLGVSVDILESHAMLKMQEIMKNWKDSYKKES